MKMNKILAGLVAVASIFATSSCSNDDNYTPAMPEVGTKVFFSNALPKTIEASSAESSVTVKVSRTDSSDAVTVPLTVSNPDAMFEVPTSVSFAAGQTDADLVITYDAEEIGFDKYSTITISVDKSVASLYGVSEYTFKIGIPAPWETIGKGTYFEQYVGTFFGVDTPLPYEIEIQKNLITNGLYRLVSPYGAAYPYNDPGDYDDSKDYYLEIHAENPDKVYIPLQKQGFDWGYGEFIMGSLAGYYLAKGDEASAEPYFGTFKDGIFSFPEGSLMIAMSDYKDGALYAGGVGGIFYAMPGVELNFSDYSVTFEDKGPFESKSVLGEVISIAMGADVASIQYATAVGTLSEEEIAEFADQIASGEVESTTTTEAGYKLIPVAEEGDYTLVAVIYDAANTRVGEASIAFTYTLPTPAETWTPIAVGDYTYSVLMRIFQQEAITDEGLVLYQSDANPQSYKIGKWGFESQDFTFTWDGTAEGITVGTDILAEASNGLYCGDAVSLLGTEKYGVNSYDAESKTYNFAVVYYIGSQPYNAGIEPFVITDKAPQSAARMVEMFNKANTKAKMADRQKANVKSFVKAGKMFTIK